MRQAIHIFLKDSRQLRVPIAISLAWTVLFAVTAMRPWLRFRSGSAWDRVSFIVQDFSFYILSGCWVVLIALAVHADALPGDRQFWLTRPYSRGSLLGSKVLFAIAYITLPMTVAQAAIVILNGLPLGPALSGLLWEQVLIALLVTVPAAALAAVTARLTHFVFSLAIAPLVVFTGNAAGDWQRLEWVRTSTSVFVFTTFAVTVVLWQFARRRTRRARTLGLTGVLTTLVAIVVIPWQTAFAVQAYLGSDQPGLGARLRPLIKPNLPMGIKPLDSRLQLRFDVSGVSDDTPIKCEAATVTIDDSRGGTWASALQRYPEWPSMSLASDGCLLQLAVPQMVKDSPGPARVRATLYATLFGAAHRETIEVGNSGTVFSDGSLCRARKSTRPMWSIARAGKWSSASRSPNAAEPSCPSNRRSLPPDLSPISTIDCRPIRRFRRF